MSHATPGKEFERKFLARVDRLPRALGDAARIEQGYLALAPNQVRIRLRGGAHIVELKGPGNMEHELYRPDSAQGDLLLRQVAPKVAALIVKDRHVIPAGFDGLQWEVDAFREGNAPLILVEIEMPTENYALEDHPWPKWVGKEVTDDDRFKNKTLAVRPFSEWPERERKKVLRLMGA